MLVLAATVPRRYSAGASQQMSFTFAMYYKPDYQRRYGICTCCHQGIEAGEQVMIGTGYWHKQLIKNHSHYNCWLEAVQTRAKGWFFSNDYKPKRMFPEKKAELNRLRAKRYYIQQKGGEPSEVIAKVEAVEKQIALVKSG